MTIGWMDRTPTTPEEAIVIATICIAVVLALLIMRDK